MQNHILPSSPGYILKKKYLPSEAVAEDHSLDSYIEYLKAQGIWVHPSVKPAMFRLSNGLLYPGLKTEQQLAGTHVLVKIPKRMILTTKKANIPQLEKLFEEDFYNNRHTNWEDRIIATFLLYTYAKKQQGLWIKMVENLSKDIDILQHWTEEDIALLGDEKIGNVCRKYKQQFQQEYQGLEEVLGKNPGLIPQEYITAANYRWLNTHLISRSFGGYLEHVTMVPFCELFNHHNSDVLYDFTYDQNNPFKHTQTQYQSPQKYCTEEQRAEVESSDGSYLSEEYYDDDEFDYLGVEVHKIKWGGKICFSLKDKETQQVEKRHAELIQWLDSELSWNDHSVMLVAQVIQKINIAKNEYMAGRKKFPETMDSLAKLRELCQVYKMKQEWLYKLLRGDKFEYRTLMEPHKPPPPPPQRFNDDKFDHFTMRMNKRDHFKANHQLYFCYGRLSNRSMLERYGMAIEGNKYDHIWVVLPIVPFIEGYPDTLERMQEKRASIKRKFKLKRREINLELLVFFRMAKWDLMRHNVNYIFKVVDIERQIEALNSCIDLVQKQAKSIQESKQLEEKLKDEKIGYHQYFATVYKLQHRRIIDLHIKAYTMMKSIVQKVSKGEKVEDIIESMRLKENEREMAWYLTKYSRMFQSD